MQKPRGTRDLYGKELHLIREVQEGLRKAFRRYGYEEIETPIFESLELFTKKSGSEVIDQIYRFEDKSKRQLALRPELTAPSIRLYNSQLKVEPKPLKIFYFGHCFRYERPQAERWRQFNQAGVELIGSNRPEADAEVIALTKDALEELELEKYTLRLGHIGLLRRILDYGGVSKREHDPVLRAIDSRDREKIEEELDSGDVDEEAREKIWELMELQGDFSALEEAEESLKQIPRVEEVMEEFRNILMRLQHMGIEDYKIDWGIARGLEYYTGSVFEIYADEVQLGGGGRYDGLIESLGGEPTPAVGVGFGVDRIAKSLEKGTGEAGKNVLDAMVLPTEESMLDESLSMARDLRKEGLSIDVNLMGRSLGKALSHADAKGTRYSVIVGPEDVSEGKVTIRNMETGDQEKILLEDVSEKLES